MRIFLFLLFTGLSLQSFGLSINSVANGNYKNPNTWDCGCVPNANDDVTISHSVFNNQYVTSRDLTINNTGSFFSSGFVWVKRDLYIAPSGLWDCTYVLIVEGDYIIDGLHKSTRGIVLDGNNVNIGGTGVISTDNWLILRYGTKTILPTADLDLPRGYGIYLYTNTNSLINKGKIRMNWLAGFGYTTWFNDVASLLEIRQWSYDDYKLDAASLDNIVIYSGKNQYVKTAVNNTYYNLTIKSEGGLYSKLLLDDLIVLKDLEILDASFRSNDFDIQIKGDWVDTGGEFWAGTATVTFNGNSQTISSTNNFEKYNHLIIESTVQTLIQTKLLVKGDLTINSTLNADGFTLVVRKDWINNGTFEHNKNLVRMGGAGVSNIIGDTEFYKLVINKNGNCNNQSVLTVRSSLNLRKGVFDTNGKVTLLSDVNGTARLAPVTNGSMVGDLTVQRYFATTTNDWHLLGAPVSGRSLQDWNDDLLTTGFTGADYPNFYFINATYYDETYPGFKDIGLLDASSINDPISIGLGWRMYLPIGVTTIDVKGPAIIGDVDFPITYTNSSSPLDDGWNLIANPYASTIDWDKNASWVKSNVNNAIYVWNPDNSQYTTYVGGVGTNGGSRYVPSTQAFWIQTNAVNPLLRIKEKAKTAVDVNIKRSEISYDYFKMKIIASNGYSDEVVVRCSEEATDGFDPALDALEMRSVVEGVPSISVASTDMEYSIYSFSNVGETRQLPLSIHVSSADVYSLAFENLIHFNGASCLAFYDNYTQQYTIVNNNTVLSLELEPGDYVGRFSLEICPPLDKYDTQFKKFEPTVDKMSVEVGADFLKIDLDDKNYEQVVVTMYDIAGRVLLNRVVSHDALGHVPLQQRISGYVLVVVSDMNGAFLVKENVFLN